MNIKKDLTLIYKTRKSHYYNEDRFFIGDDYVLVMDGATGLVPSSLLPSTGAHFVNYIKRHLPKKYIHLKDALKKISIKYYEQYFLNNADMSILPSVGMVVVNIDDNRINLDYIGDSQIVIENKEHQFKNYQQQELVKLDDISLNVMKEYALKNNVSFKKARQNNNDILIKHRLKANKKEGYAIYTCSRDGVFNFSHESIEKKDISSISLLTDGFEDIWSTFNIYKSMDETISKINSKDDLDILFNEIKEKAYSDIDFNKYNRFKVIDDITIVKIIL